MAISECVLQVGDNGQELVRHGTSSFPIACYHDDLRKMEVPWHWHEEWEAAFITQGKCVVKTDREVYTVSAGEGFFINSGILHGCWDLEDSGCRFHSLVFHPRLVGGSMDSVFYQDYVTPLLDTSRGESLHLKPSVAWHAQALDAVETAWQACSREEAGYELHVRSALSELVWQLHRHLPAAKTAPSPKAIRDGERIKRMLGYIDEHIAENITTAQIARSASISESECLRCFRTVISTTPIQYVRHRRIRWAAQLLQDPQERISDIAAACGFQDFSYFSKTFRELEGCTPTEYRQRSK